MLVRDAVVPRRFLLSGLQGRREEAGTLAKEIVTATV